MAATWARLSEGQQEECASASCGHAQAAWRMDAGGTGSYYCETCRSKIAGPLAELEPRGCPTPGACAAVERIAALEAALRGVVGHWREFGGMMIYNNAANRDDYGMDDRIEAAAKLIETA